MRRDLDPQEKLDALVEGQAIFHEALAKALYAVDRRIHDGSGRLQQAVLHQLEDDLQKAFFEYDLEPSSIEGASRLYRSLNTAVDELKP